MNYALYIMNWIVVPGRLELPTSTLSVWRSNQLSYRTVVSAEIWRAASLSLLPGLLCLLSWKTDSWVQEVKVICQLTNFFLLFFRIVVVIESYPYYNYILTDRCSVQEARDERRQPSLDSSAVVCPLSSQLLLLLFVVSVCQADAMTHICSPERRCSSRTFRYGYLVTT